MGQNGVHKDGDDEVTVAATENAEDIELDSQLGPAEFVDGDDEEQTP